MKKLFFSYKCNNISVVELEDFFRNFYPQIINMVKTSNIYCRYLTTAYKNLDNINQSAIVATRFGFKTCRKVKI